LSFGPSTALKKDLHTMSMRTFFKTVDEPKSGATWTIYFFRGPKGLAEPFFQKRKNGFYKFGLTATAKPWASPKPTRGGGPWTRNILLPGFF
jgi:hypothetical protein